MKNSSLKNGFMVFQKSSKNKKREKQEEQVNEKSEKEKKKRKNNERGKIDSGNTLSLHLPPSISFCQRLSRNIFLY